jgi:signal transduction histidine kinase
MKNKPAASSGNIRAGLGDGAAQAKLAPAWLAWTVAGVCVGLLVLAMLLYALTGSGVQPNIPFSPGAIAVAAVFPLVGALILARQSHNAIGWILCAMGFSEALAEFARRYAIYALVAQPGVLPGGALLAWIWAWSWVPGFVLIAFLLLLFPNGHLVSPRWQWVAWLAAAGLALLVVTLATVSWPVRGLYLLTHLGEIELGYVGTGGAVLSLGSICASALALVRRFRRAQGVERQQLKWFTYAGALTVLVLLGNILLGTYEGNQNGDLGSTLGQFLEALTLAALPVAIGIAILKHRLFDIDLLINRSLVYGTLTVCVVGFYVLVVGALGVMLQTQGSLAISLLATGLIAVLFQPLHARLQRLVNHLMYGERDDPYQVLTRLGQRLEATLAAEEVLPSLVETLARSLKLPYVAIRLKQDGAFLLAAAYGSPRPESEYLPLTYQGETIGELILAPRAPGESFTAGERQLLQALARQAGIAVHGVLLTAALERSRLRIVAAREEARRRLGNDLHDGLGLILTALLRKVEAAATLLAQDPVATAALLADLQQQTKAAISETRQLAHALHPPDLEVLGLLAALREQVEQATPLDRAGLQIRLDVPAALPPLPLAVEAAAYYIVQEALTNVYRHAHARHCQVRLAYQPCPPGRPTGLGLVRTAVLELEVRDDGCGQVPAEVTRGPGLGLRSMGARAAELGGTCVIEALPAGGTRVYARLPCTQDAAG